MKIELKPSDREVMEGLVERLTYHNADNGFFLATIGPIVSIGDLLGVDYVISM